MQLEHSIKFTNELISKELKKQKRERDRKPYFVKNIDYQKPAYGTAEYWQAVNNGQISWEQAARDEAAYQTRRNRSLKACLRYSLSTKRRYPKPNIRAYTPETSANVDLDRNLKGSADKTVRFIMRYAYQRARKTRSVQITVSYIAKGLKRANRTIQRHLRALEEEGYIKVYIVRSVKTKMVECLQIELLAPLFPDHHKEKWASSVEKQDMTFLSDKQSHIFNIRESRKLWVIRCMNGVRRALLKTKKRLDLPDLIT